MRRGVSVVAQFGKNPWKSPRTTLGNIRLREEALQVRGLGLGLSTLEAESFQSVWQELIRIQNMTFISGW